MVTLQERNTVHRSYFQKHYQINEEKKNKMLCDSFGIMVLNEEGTLPGGIFGNLWVCCELSQ